MKSIFSSVHCLRCPYPGISLCFISYLGHSEVRGCIQVPWSVRFLHLGHRMCCGLEAAVIAQGVYLVFQCSPETGLSDESSLLPPEKELHTAFQTAGDKCDFNFEPGFLWVVRAYWPASVCSQFVFKCFFPGRFPPLLIGLRVALGMLCLFLSWWSLGHAHGLPKPRGWQLLWTEHLRDDVPPTQIPMLKVSRST